MNPLQPSPMLISNHRPTLSNDVEMLQTDVMRFFAILCLCLMAIFALVKALPMAPPAASPTMAEPAEQAEKAAEDEQNILVRLAKSHQELKKVKQSLDRSRRELKTRENKLTLLADTIDQQQRIRASLTSQIKTETQKLKTIQTALDRTHEEVKQSHQQNQLAPEKPSAANPPRPPAKEVFILRFASDAALQKLIAAGQVNFYAMTGKKAWQLRLTGGRPGYFLTHNLQQIYEMQSTTVPHEYAVAFQQQVAAFGPSTVTWGVTLPAQMTVSINRLLKGQKGGDLVIMPGGEVVLK